MDVINYLNRTSNQVKKTLYLGFLVGKLPVYRVGGTGSIPGWTNFQLV